MPLSKSQTTSQIKIDLTNIPDSSRLEVLEQVGNYILTSILDDVGRGLSPVTGKSFKYLNGEYAEEEKGGDKLPNLELEGDMLGALEYRVRGDTVEYGIYDPDQAIKSYGHNTGMDGHKWLDGKVPKRKFIPDEKESLRADIIKGINKLVDEYRVESEPDFLIEQVIEQESVLDRLLRGLLGN